MPRTTSSSSGDQSNKYEEEKETFTLHAKKAKEYPASMNKIDKQNNPQ